MVHARPRNAVVVLFAVAVAVDFFMKKPQELQFLACCGFEGKTTTSAAIPTMKTETEKESKDAVATTKFVDILCST